MTTNFTKSTDFAFLKEEEEGAVAEVHSVHSVLEEEEAHIVTVNMKIVK